MSKQRLPRTIKVVPERGMVMFKCPACLRLHVHGWTGASGYRMPQCPDGTGYWLTPAGYWLEEVAA